MRSKSGNLFLDALTPRSLARVTPLLEHVSLPRGSSVVHVGEACNHVIFPIGGLVSAMTTMSDGFAVEVMIVGREGFYGLQVPLGRNISQNEAMIQIAGSFYRMPSSDFERIVQDDIALLRRVLRYAQATLDTMAQYSACNCLHSTSERCARWLLMAHDRVPSEDVMLTHEYLAVLLGVPQPGVSLAAAMMEQGRLIRYQRGHIQILDRIGLEAAACECYAAVNDAFVRQLGYDVRKRVDRKGDARAGVGTPAD